MKKLVKSSNRLIMGVCGGVGEYVNLDPTVVRIIWVLATVFTEFKWGIIIYMIGSFVIPEPNSIKKNETD